LTGTCEFHEEMMKAREALEHKQGEQEIALEGKISKGSLKWVATLLGLPAIMAALAIYAFMQSADYRFGSNQQAQTNAANIRLLDERTMTLRSDMVNLQASMNNSVGKIERSLDEMDKKLDRFLLRHDGKQP